MTRKSLIVKEMANTSYHITHETTFKYRKGYTEVKGLEFLLFSCSILLKLTACGDKNVQCKINFHLFILKIEVFHYDLSLNR